MQITLTARALHDLVKPVLPLAGKDSMLPVINAVLIERRGDYLTATATDRFRIGICRQRYEGEGEFRALVPLGVVRNLLALFKPSRSSDNSLTLAVKDDTIYAEASGGLGFDFADMRVGYRLQDGQYPGVREMVRKALANEPTGSAVGLSADFLADWRHAGATVEVKIVSPYKPMIVRSGNHFLGLVMPRKLIDGDTAPADDWPDFLADDEPAPAKKARSGKKAVAA